MVIGANTSKISRVWGLGFSSKNSSKTNSSRNKNSNKDSCAGVIGR